MANHDAKKLAKRIKPLKLGKKLAEHLREKGAKLSVFRKAHVAILAPHLNPAEIDLLQGRTSTILVKHYVRYVREIARRYGEAYRKYISMLLS